MESINNALVADRLKYAGIIIIPERNVAPPPRKNDVEYTCVVSKSRPEKHEIHNLSSIYKSKTQRTLNASISFVYSTELT